MRAASVQPAVNCLPVTRLQLHGWRQLQAASQPQLPGPELQLPGLAWPSGSALDPSEDEVARARTKPGRPARTKPGRIACGPERSAVALACTYIHTSYSSYSHRPVRTPVRPPASRPASQPACQPAGPKANQPAIHPASQPASHNQPARQPAIRNPLKLTELRVTSGNLMGFRIACSLAHQPAIHPASQPASQPATSQPAQQQPQVSESAWAGPSGSFERTGSTWAGPSGHFERPGSTRAGLSGHFERPVAP